MNFTYTSKWLFQKIFAILFLIASFYTVYSLYGLLSAIILHSNIGLSSIIDDYIHEESLKQKIILIKNFFFVVLFFITIFSLVKLNL